MACREVSLEEAKAHLCKMPKKKCEERAEKLIQFSKNPFDHLRPFIAEWLDSLFKIELNREPEYRDCISCDTAWKTFY